MESNIDNILSDFLLEKVRNEYFPKYISEKQLADISFEEIKNKYDFHCFLNKVSDESCLQYNKERKTSQVEPLSYIFFNRFLNDKGEKFQNNTRIAIALFLGFKDLDNFRKKNRDLLYAAGSGTEIKKKDKIKEEPKPKDFDVVKDNSFNYNTQTLVPDIDTSIINPTYETESNLSGLKMNRIVLFSGIMVVLLFIISSFLVNITILPNKNFRNFAKEKTFTVQFDAFYLLPEPELEVYGLEFNTEKQRFKILPVQRGKNNITINCKFPGAYQLRFNHLTGIQATQNFYLYTNGWAASLEFKDMHNDEYNKYLESNIFINNGVLSLSEYMGRRVFWNDFFYIDSFPNCADDMMVELRARNQDSIFDGNDIRLAVYGETGRRITANFVKADVNNYAYLILSDTLLQDVNVNADLKNFSKVDVKKWNNFKFKISNMKLSIYLNDSILCNPFPYINKIGKFKGVNITFKGAGELDYIRITDLKSKNLIFSDDFER